MSALQTALMLAMLQQQEAQRNAQASLESGKTSALSELGKGYETARGDIQSSVQPQLGALSSGYSDAQSMLDPYYKTGVDANNTISGALGMGGNSGRSAAQAAFSASPGYQWMRDQASDNALRRASVFGGLGGNQAAELATLGANLANQEYGSWFDRLNAVANRGYNAATGKADLSTGLGANTANVYGTTGARLADLATGYGNNSAGIYTGTAANKANAAMQGSNLATSTLMNAGNTQAQMDYSRSQVLPTLAAGGLGALGGIGSGMAYGGTGLFRR